MRRLLAVLLTLVAILAAGWLALRRADIPFDTLEAAYSSAQSRMLLAGDVERVHYRDQGLREGETLVLVHGFAASLHTWEPWVDLLADDYRIISLDLPGHGLTRGFATEDVGIDTFMETIDAVTGELGIDRFTLVGSSMGGNTAWKYALKSPQRLDALVLVGASGWPPSDEELRNRPMVFRLLQNGFARRLLKDLDMSAMIRDGLENSFADPSQVSDAMVERYGALSRGPGHRAALLHISAGRGNRGYANSDTLGAIDLPVLVLQGAQDKVVPARFGKAFADAIPGAQLKLYENVGHLPHEEAAQRSADDLRTFLTARVNVRADEDAADTQRIVAADENNGN